MEEEMMMKIMGFSSFGNPKLIGQDDQVVEESPPRRHPEPGIEDRRRRRRRSRERDDGRSRSMDRKKKKRSRSRSREKKKSDRNRSRDRDREGKKPRSRSPKTRSNRERRRDRNENSSTASWYLHDDRKSKIKDDIKNENYSEKISSNIVLYRKHYASNKEVVEEESKVFIPDEKDVCCQQIVNEIVNEVVEEESKVFIPEEKDVCCQQIVNEIVEDILARVFRKTRGKCHGEMAKYFTQAISKICHLKYEEANFVAEQMIDAVEIAFPDVKLNLQRPYEMAKLKENNNDDGDDPELMEFRRELHHKLRSSNVKKANFRFSEIVDLTVNYLGEM